jgi:hypothetical protein
VTGIGFDPNAGVALIEIDGADIPAGAAEVRATIMQSAGSGGGGDAYVTSAVNFDGNTVLKNLTVAATDSRYFFMSLWVNHHALDTHQSSHRRYPFIVEAVCRL